MPPTAQSVGPRARRPGRGGRTARADGIWGRSDTAQADRSSRPPAATAVRPGGGGSLPGTVCLQKVMVKSVACKKRITEGIPFKSQDLTGNSYRKVTLVQKNTNNSTLNTHLFMVAFDQKLPRSAKIPKRRICLKNNILVT